MAAAPFTGTLVFKGMRTGKPVFARCTMSDVAAAGWVFQDGGTTLQLESGQDWLLTDVIIVTGGTDTTYSDLFVNQANSGIAIDHKSNLNTSNFRQFVTSPLTFAGGSQIKLLQRA